MGSIPPTVTIVPRTSNEFISKQNTIEYARLLLPLPVSIAKYIRKHEGDDDGSQSDIEQCIEG